MPEFAIESVCAADHEREVPPGVGLQHAKVLQAGDYLIVGSTNFTVSSKANLEISVLLHLTDAGSAAMDRLFARWLALSAPFSDELVAEAEDARVRRSDRRSASRSVSPSRSRR